MNKVLLASLLAVCPSLALAIPMQPKDVLQACPVVDGMTIRAYELPEAVQLLNDCFGNIFGGRLLTVRAEKGRFGVVMHPAKPGELGSHAMMEVEGIILRVSGKLLMGDATPGDLAYGVQKRGGRLMGFFATVDSSGLKLAR